MESTPIRPEELLSLEAYERVRAARRAEVIGLRELRRVELGPWLSVVFENRETVLYQIQEMLRIERIVEPERIRHEIETYEELLPAASALSGTLFIEITDAAQRQAALPELLGIEGRLRLKAGPLLSPGEDKRPIDPSVARPQAACVHYLRFPIEPALQAAFRSGEPPLWLEVDHPRYAHAARLKPEQSAELSRDLS
ncbi:MAG: DUF3501 family protein [Elusimicrobia bacterium]|nr:DUF3501 family protein [Elusimicrobiota bacterium]